jgi:hypothetical protein
MALARRSRARASHRRSRDPTKACNERAPTSVQHGSMLSRIIPAPRPPVMITVPSCNSVAVCLTRGGEVTRDELMAEDRQVERAGCNRTHAVGEVPWKVTPPVHADESQRRMRRSMIKKAVLSYGHQADTRPRWRRRSCSSRVQPARHRLHHRFRAVRVRPIRYLECSDSTRDCFGLHPAVTMQQWRCRSGP